MELGEKLGRQSSRNHIPQQHGGAWRPSETPQQGRTDSKHIPSEVCKQVSNELELIPSLSKDYDMNYSFVVQVF